MPPLHRFIGMLAMALVPSVSLAQGFDPGMIGGWSASEHGWNIQLHIHPDGSFDGSGRTQDALLFSACSFDGKLRPSPHRSIARLTGNARCIDFLPGSLRRGETFGEMYLRSGRLRVSIRWNQPGDALHMHDVMFSKNGAFLGTSPGIVAQDIPGHWSGSADGTQVTLDLAGDGSFSGAIDGGDLSGCAFEGTTDPGDALLNNEGSFVDFGTARLSGCHVAANDGGGYFVLLGATAKSLGISIFADEQDVEEDAAVLKIHGLSRNAGGLGSSSGSAAFAPFVGHWVGEQFGLHLALEVRGDGSFAIMYPHHSLICKILEVRVGALAIVASAMCGDSWPVRLLVRKGSARHLSLVFGAADEFDGFTDFPDPLAEVRFQRIR